MTTATIQEVQTHLPAMIAQLKPGEELMIMEHDQTVARLVAERHAQPKMRQPGSAVGKFFIIEDDDTHLEDFRESMQ